MNITIDFNGKTAAFNLGNQSLLVNGFVNGLDLSVSKTIIITL